jgi:hypothetical protein
MVIAFPTDGFSGQVHLPVDELSLLKYYIVINQENTSHHDIEIQTN